MAKNGHQEHKDLQKNDRIVRWVRDHDIILAVTDSASAFHKFGSETGLISDLHDECLQVMKQLRRAWQKCKDNIDLRPQDRAGIGHCYGMLNLWGDTVQGEKLEASLDVVPALRETILGAFVTIGHALLLGLCKHHKQSQITEPEQYQIPTSNLKVLLEKASHALTAEESDCSTLQGHDATDDESSDGESASDGNEDNSPGLQTESWATALIRVLSFRTKLLMDLLPTIQQILSTTERGYRPGKNQHPGKFYVSEGARQWIRQIFDRFRDADESLAERLGQANAQRYEELRREKDPAVVATEGVDQPKSLFRPATTLRDSGLGTSIITPGETPASVASHSSFLPSLADGTSRRVPKTPDAVALGIPFDCEICGCRLSTIRDRAQWKAHVFADIKPYVCTFNDCSDQLTVFPTRKLWAEHEFYKHRYYSFFQCYVCSQHLETEEMLLNHLRNKHSLTESRPQQLGAIIQRAKNVQERPIEGERCPLCRRTDWSTQRAFVKHLGKHLEDIALLALPLDIDSENETKSDEPHKVTTWSPAAYRNRRIPDSEWDQYREKITKLYLEKRRPLREVIRLLAEEDKFFLSVWHLKSRLRKWGVRRTFKSSDKVDVQRYNRHGAIGSSPVDGNLIEAVPLSVASRSPKEPSLRKDSALGESHSQASEPDQPSQSRSTADLPQTHAGSIAQPPDLDLAHGSSHAESGAVSSESPMIEPSPDVLAPVRHRFFCPSKDCRNKYVSQRDYVNHMKSFHPDFPPHDPSTSLGKWSKGVSSKLDDRKDLKSSLG